jgi:hypothetical protein
MEPLDDTDEFELSHVEMLRMLLDDPFRYVLIQNEQDDLRREALPMQIPPGWDVMVLNDQARRDHNLQLHPAMTNRIIHWDLASDVEINNALEF